jgi:hypothetical protein
MVGLLQQPERPIADRVTDGEAEGWRPRRLFVSLRVQISSAMSGSEVDGTRPK